MKHVNKHTLGIAFLIAILATACSPKVPTDNTPEPPKAAEETKKVAANASTEDAATKETGEKAAADKLAAEDKASISKELEENSELADKMATARDKIEATKGVDCNSAPRARIEIGQVSNGIQNFVVHIVCVDPAVKAAVGGNATLVSLSGSRDAAKANYKLDLDSAVLSSGQLTEEDLKVEVDATEETQSSASDLVNENEQRLSAEDEKKCLEEEAAKAKAATVTVGQ